MVSNEVLKSIPTILLSSVTAVAITFLIHYMKERKRRAIEQITHYDDRMEIIDFIAKNSTISLIFALVIAYLGIDFIHQVPFIILLATNVVFFTYIFLRFHKSFLIKTYQNKESRCGFTLISLFISIVWVATLISILLIKQIGDWPTFTAFTLAMSLYTLLFNLRMYFKWTLTRWYKKIIVVTVGGDIYESIELVEFDDYVAIYENTNDKRIIIPKHQIKAIDYEYQETTIADFIDKEH